MIARCCGSRETSLEPVFVAQTATLLTDGQEDNKCLPPSEVVKAAQTASQYEMKKEVRFLTPIERDLKYVFSIKFKTKPLGMIVTASEDGTCAYVTHVDGKINKAVDNNKLPLNSKLLKVNDKEVELDSFEAITSLTIDCLWTLPLVLTFCHPDGLTVKERPDPSPKVSNVLSLLNSRFSIERWTRTSIPEGEVLEDYDEEERSSVNSPTNSPIKRAATETSIGRLRTRGELTNSEWGEIEKLLVVIERAERSGDIKSKVSQIRRLIPKPIAQSPDLSASVGSRRSIFAQPSSHTMPRIMTRRSMDQMTGIHDIFNATFFPSCFRDGSTSNVLITTATEIKSSKYVKDKHGIRHRPKRVDEETKLLKLKTELDEEEIREIFDPQEWGQWGWHAFDLLGVCDEAMGLTAVKVFSESNRYGFKEIDVRLEDLASFFCLLGFNYKTNPIHNELHAVDIFITTKYFLDNIKTLEKLSPKDCFALLVAAASQGVCHPGVTNAYLVNTGDDLAITYNDHSILENWHLAQTFRILKCFPRFFQNWNVGEKQRFRKTMVNCILGSDVLHHSEYQDFVSEKYEAETEDGRYGILPCLVHSAGISTIAKPTLQMKEGVDRTFEEFFAQGELERKYNMPISPLCDKRKINIPEIQIGFIRFLARPWFQLMLEKVSQEAFSAAVKHLTENERYWDRKLLERNAVASVYSVVEEDEDVL